jgi:flavin-dependent dehydrogenase
MKKVIIVGAGLAGSYMAYAMGKNGSVVVFF